ncbi:GPW/gp25 family protein [Lelliottia sp. SL45]|uniref:GPW/gp25 family protein n=1 Tax=Lelliottia sp. SL45 TaxID=2994665 RepID=UPI00227598E9|nr:GPW/gp25 family protein [Lelliottia sp. SL45]MCY1697152.1 GPW/gp25 family protein [Lelliottia sp. SL45]
MSFAISLSRGGRNSTLVEDIDQAISIILFTRPGERIYDPAYGCKLLNLLDAPHYFLQLAIVSVVEAIERYERRVDVMRVDIGVNDSLLDGAALAKGLIQIRLTWRLSVSGLVQTRIYQSDGRIFPLAA